MKIIPIFLKAAFTAFLIILFASCLSVFSMFGLMQKPSPETPESIVNYCKINDAFYDYLYMSIDDEAYIENAKLSNISLGNIEAFDKKKRKIFVETVHGPNRCPGVFLNNYQSDNPDIVSFSDNDSSFWSKLAHLKLIDKRNGLRDLTDSDHNFDFFIFAGWAKIQTEKHAKRTFNYAKHFSQIDSTKNVCVILLNYDMEKGMETFNKMQTMAKKSKKEAKKQAKKEKKNSKTLPK